MNTTLKYRTLGLALTTSILIGCGGGGGGGGGGGTTRFQAFYFGTNGATAPDPVQVTGVNFAALGSNSTGGNEGVALFQNSLVQGNDLAGARRIELFGNSFRRFTSGSTINGALDSTLFVATNGAVKGLLTLENFGLVLATKSNGRTTAGSIEAYSIAVRGTSVTPATPVFALAPYTGTNIGAGAPNPSTSPWDVLYSASTDRLFVALQDGFVAVYDNFLLNPVSGAPQNPNGRNASRFFRPSDGTTPAVNLHGIDFLANGNLLLTDVGDAASATDGRIFVVAGNFSTLTGDVSGSNVATIGGSNTNLGNPVDCFAIGNVAYVLEKSNDRVLVYSNLLSGNRAADFSFTITKPESGFFNDGGERSLLSANDLDETSANFGILGFAAVQNPAGAANANEGRILTVAADLSAVSATLDLGSQSLENVMIAPDGTAWVTSVPGGDGTEALGNGAIGRVGFFGRAGRFGSATVLDATYDDVSAIAGASPALTDPKGIDIDPTSGLVFVADFATSTTGVIRVFGSLAAGNVTPVFSATNLGGTNRRPWDLDYDSTNDRLFVACTDGFVIVYDNFVARGLAATLAGPDRSFNARYNNGTMDIDSINMHGIEYERSTDTIILSDVGSAGSSTDGAVMSFRNASVLNGTQLRPDFVYAGANTLLGNPVDLVLRAGFIYVAEKANGGGAILQFPRNVSGAQNVAPASSLAVADIESITILTTDVARSR